jgi:hypothetical protein
MLSLTNEHVRPDQGRRGGYGRADRRERFLHGPEHPRHAPEESIPPIQYVGTPRRREFRADEEAPIVADVLDHAKPSRTPSHLKSWEETVYI